VLEHHHARLGFTSNGKGADVMSDPTPEQPKAPEQGKPKTGPDGALDPDYVRDVIEHTDSGSGRSQLDHWPPGDPNESH
jgi:hypothetical protein